MQYLAEIGNGIDLKFYYNKKVYDPHYSSIEVPMVANTFVFGRIKLLDVATGCGITGLILKRIHPTLDVTLSDIDPEACRIAKLNSKRLGLPVTVVEADLIPDNGEKYHVITANLPTFDPEQMENEVLHGPELAYDGGSNPLHLYSALFKQAKDRCVVLVCEVQAKRQEAFIALAGINGWNIVERTDYAFALVSAEKELNTMLQQAKQMKLDKHSEKA